MKLYLVLMVLGLVFGTKAFAGDVKNCAKLKLTGKYSCEFNGDALKLNIKNINKVLTVIAESENESFTIDGSERARYNWSEDFTYTSSCSTDALTIVSFKKGVHEGTIVIAPKGSTIQYSILKKRQSLTLDCIKL